MLSISKMLQYTVKFAATLLISHKLAIYHSLSEPKGKLLFIVEIKMNAIKLQTLQFMLMFFFPEMASRDVCECALCCKALSVKDSKNS